MRKVLGHWLQQFTCPNCKEVGAAHPECCPLCHKCKTKMLPSHNEVIIKDWENYQANCKKIIKNEEMAQS
jgi:hypothetical protein